MNEDWRASALCAQVDPELFFPPKNGSAREAKRLCQVCDVREDCLNWALANATDGVCGGLTERERRKLLRRVVAA